MISSNEKENKSKTKDIINSSSNSKQPAKKAKGKATSQNQASSSKPALDAKDHHTPTNHESGAGSNDEEAYESKIGKNIIKKGVLIPSKSLEVTLFDRMERMWGDEIKQMLDTQYR